MFKRYFKTADVSTTIIFNAETDEERERINAGLPHNFIDIVSLDGAEGDPVSPDAGTYTVYYQDVPNGGFKSVADGGVIDATRTGGTAEADGNQLGASFLGNPCAIKIVPAAIGIATHYRVYIKQNLT